MTFPTISIVSNWKCFERHTKHIGKNKPLHLGIVGTDVKLAGDVDKPLLGRFEISHANTPRAIDDKDQVIDCGAAA